MTLLCSAHPTPPSTLSLQLLFLTQHDHIIINAINIHNNTTHKRCFWEPAESLLKQPGVLATTVGYTGAPPNKPPPSYDTVCFGNDYVEAVRVVYDDTILDYTTLLDKFFEVQKPGLSRQYASIVFVTDDNEEEEEVNKWKNAAIKTKVKRQSDNLPYELVEIEPTSSFYRAEEYHQRYWEKQRLRAGLAVLLVAGASGAYDDFGGGVIVFLVGAGWMILERLVVRDVRELKSGDMILELKNGLTKRSFCCWNAALQWAKIFNLCLERRRAKHSWALRVESKVHLILRRGMKGKDNKFDRNQRGTGVGLGPGGASFCGNE
eukprot:scaffold10022_cov156-Skeletonema_marinoi.AAC.27